MKPNFCFLTVVLSAILISCDPVHDLRLENKTDNKIDVIYSPALDLQELNGHEPTGIEVNGQKMNLVTLAPSETIRIGHVVASYNPKPYHIHVEYLEVRLGTDTLRLIGRNSIFSTIQKVESLDWRLIIRN